MRLLGRRGIIRRQRAQTGTGLALSGTVVLHAAVAGVLFTRPPGRAPRVPVYAVQLVAAPAPAPEARPAPEVVERPAAQPAPALARRPPPRRTSVAREAPPPAPTNREPAPRTTPQETPAPGVEPSTGTDVATVSLPGVAFPYPEYLRNIVSEVFRRWHRPLGETPLQAEVMFFIHRNGSISNLQFIKRSGSFAFDLEAEGAVEAAGNAKAFGPLPDGYPADVLPVSFFFNPGAIR